jgi:Leucine-rich repeat (LRR) protein
LLESSQITGTLPPEISGLESLIHLSIADNELFGTLPPEIGELEELTELYLNDNQFTGTVPYLASIED